MSDQRIPDDNAQPVNVQPESDLSTENKAPKVAPLGATLLGPAFIVAVIGVVIILYFVLQ